MKTVLAISWWFPPLLGARSIQVGKTLHNLALRGWKVSVVAPGESFLPFGTKKDEALLRQYGENLEIIQIAPPLAMHISQMLGSIMPSLALLPDDQILWAKKIVRMLKKKIDFKSFDALISFGHPWSDHIAGREIAKASGLKWLAHFSDPWADNPYNTHLSAEQKKKMVELERECIFAADKLLFTNQASVELVMEKYPSKYKKKAFVVPHGYDSKLLEALDNRKSQKASEKLNILHIGNIYRIRSPKSLFLALGSLKTSKEPLTDLLIRFVGTVSRKAEWEQFLREKGISDLVEFVDAVPYFDSLAIGNEADVLLTIDADSDNESVFLPSKLIDYLSLKKVILGITPEKGVSADLLRSLKMPVAAPGDVEQIAESLRLLYGQWKNGELRVGSSFQSVAEHYDIRKTSEEFDLILSDMVAEK